jgi:hypothetical protein
MLFVLNSSVFSERMPLTEASAAARLVAWEIFWAMAVERIRISSAWDSWSARIAELKNEA